MGLFFITLALITATATATATATTTATATPPLEVSIRSPRNGILTNRDNKITIICTTNRENTNIIFYKFLHTRINLNNLVWTEFVDGGPKYTIYNRGTVLEIYKPNHNDVATYICEVENFNISANISLNLIMGMPVTYEIGPQSLSIQVQLKSKGNIDMEYLEIEPIYNEFTLVKRFGVHRFESCRTVNYHPYFNLYICDIILPNPVMEHGITYEITSVNVRLYYGSEHNVYEERVYIY